MKTAIVTGAAGLIGRGICRALIDDGWTVAAFDLKPGPDQTRSVICDVGDEASVQAAFAELGWDALDLLVNNAGVARPDSGPLSELSLAEWREITDSHLTGTPDESSSHSDVRRRGRHPQHGFDQGQNVRAEH